MEMSRRVSTPEISRKRKERETPYLFKPSMPVRSSVCSGPKSPPTPTCSNQLLAGYMAHEFLTRGTLFGQNFDPARYEAAPVVIGSSRKPQETEPNLTRECQSYADMASILKDDGTHIPGIVNPTQLATWIKRLNSKRFDDDVAVHHLLEIQKE